MRGKPASVVNGGYGIRSYTEENIPTYVYKSMYFFPRLPYLDRHRWVRAGWKLFEHYVRDHGTPDIIHAHSMNHAGILAQQIHEKTGIPFVLTEHSSTYARQTNRKTPISPFAPSPTSTIIKASISCCPRLRKH